MVDHFQANWVVTLVIILKCNNRRFSIFIPFKFFWQLPPGRILKPCDQNAIRVYLGVIKSISIFLPILISSWIGGWSNQYQYHSCNICLLFKSQSISVIVIELEQVRSKRHRFWFLKGFEIVVFKTWKVFLFLKPKRFTDLDFWNLKTLGILILIKT